MVHDGVAGVWMLECVLQRGELAVIEPAYGLQVNSKGRYLGLFLADESATQGRRRKLLTAGMFPRFCML